MTELQLLDYIDGGHQQNTPLENDVVATLMSELNKEQRSSFAIAHLLTYVNSVQLSKKMRERLGLPAMPYKGRTSFSSDLRFIDRRSPFWSSMTDLCSDAEDNFNNQSRNGHILSVGSVFHIKSVEYVTACASTTFESITPDGRGHVFVPGVWYVPEYFQTKQQLVLKAYQGYVRQNQTSDNNERLQQQRLWIQQLTHIPWGIDRSIRGEIEYPV